MTSRLLLIRHGQVDFGSGDFMDSPRGRQWDPPLGPEGLAQSELLAARLSLIEPTVRLFVSPFRRCRQAVSPFEKASGLVGEIVPDLGEVFIGDWEGVSFEEIISRDEELARRFRDQEPMFNMAPGAESGQALRARVVASVDRALSTSEDATVVVVTHGGSINAYLGHVMGISHEMFFLPDNTSINTVRVDGTEREMLFLNDVRHLTTPAIFAPPAGVSSRHENASLTADVERATRGDEMALKFLSDEWMEAVQEALNSNDAVKRAIGAHSARIQQVISSPAGEKKYWLELQDGQVLMGPGEMEGGAEATISQDYETAVALSKSEMSAMAAYMSGRLKISGDLMKMMQLQGVMAQVPAALKNIEVEY